jgi:hypothetical protein
LSTLAKNSADAQFISAIVILPQLAFAWVETPNINAKLKIVEINNLLISTS